MKEIKGNLLDFHNKNNYIGITTNGVVKPNGELIMGAGLAKQIRDKIAFKEIPSNLGWLVKQQGNNVYFLPEYGLFSFPTKHNWWEKSDMRLVDKSCKQLWEFMSFKDKERNFYLPRPGCGLGGLNWLEVKPILLNYFENESRLFIVDLKYGD